MFLFILLPVLFGGPVWAEESDRDVTVVSETALGKNTLSEDLSASSEGWNVGLVVTRVRQSDADAVAVSRAVRGGLVTSHGDFDFGVDVEASSTPAENLTSAGVTGTVGYAVLESLDVSLAGGADSYLVSYSGVRTTRRGGSLPSEGRSSLGQTHLQFGLRWRPSRALRLSASATTYRYNRSVSDFETNLDFPGGLLGGMPRFSYSLSALWRLSELWQVSATQSWTILAADQSRSTQTALSGGRRVASAWLVSVGFQRSVSSGYTDSMGLIGVEYSF